MKKYIKARLPGGVEVYVEEELWEWMKLRDTVSLTGGSKTLHFFLAIGRDRTCKMIPIPETP